MKVLLQGYIGHQNFGDDLLLKLAIDNVKDIKGAEIYCLVPEGLDVDYIYSYCDKIVILRYKISIPIFFYKKFDKVYFIGGGVFFDYKTNTNIRDYIKKRFSNYLRFNIPRLLGTKFAGIGIGIGPFNSNRSFKIYQAITKNFNLLGVRDEKSFEYGNSFGIKNLFLANDQSLLLNEELNELRVSKKDEKLIVICPRSYKHDTTYEKHLDELVKFSNYLKEKEYRVKWCFLQPEEKHLVEKLESNNITSLIWNPYDMSILDFIKEFSLAEFVFTSRMHAVYISGLLGVKTIPIKVHPKLEYSSRLFNKSPYIIDPKANLSDYINALDSEFVSDVQQFNNELELVKLVNHKIQDWLSL